MRNFIKALLCSAALSVGSLSGVAHAESRNDRPYTTHQDWEVFAAAKFNGCYMVKEWDRGTQFYVAYDIATDSVVMRISNPGWPVEEGVKYNIKFVFDGYDKWNGTMTGMGEHSVIHTSLKLGFMKAFMARNHVAIYSNDRYVTSMNLNGSMAATVHVVQCAQKYQNVTRPAPDAPSQPQVRGRQWNT